MARKKKTSVSQVQQKKRIIHMTIACFLLLVACLAIFGEYQSQLGYQVHKFGMYVFGAYYQWIFTPMILALGVMMLIKKDF